MNQLTCPEREQIARYVSGNLDEDGARKVSRHLADCRHCSSLADQWDLGKDPLVALLRQPQPESPYSEEPQCDRSLQRLTILRQRFPEYFQPSTEGPVSDGGLEMPYVLGDYLVVQWIGGNRGAVYKAIHVEMERPVALKTLPPELSDDEPAAERFEREIKAVGGLNHPNIVRAYDSREMGGRRFLVMEFVDGHDLDKLLRRTGRITVAEACHLAMQAAEGLQYIFENHWVHRDIKPANLMLSREGCLKLLDLGLARFRALPQSSWGNLTAAGVVMGTADYMAPEQVRASHEVDIRADLYALGCTLYELLAGRPPFDVPACETVFDKLSAQLRRTPAPIQELRDDIPDGLASVLERMLSKEPERRFQTPQEVVTALKPYAAGADLAALVTSLEAPQHREDADAGETAHEEQKEKKQQKDGGEHDVHNVHDVRDVREKLHEPKDPKVVAKVPWVAPVNVKNDKTDDLACDDNPPFGVKVRRWISKRENRWFWELLVTAALLLVLLKVADRWGWGFFGDPANSGLTAWVQEPAGSEPDWPRGTHDEPDGDSPFTEAEAEPETPPQETAEPQESLWEQPAEVPEDPPVEPVEPLDPPAWQGVQARLNHEDGVYRGPPAGAGGQGEEIQVTIESEQPGFVYLLVTQADGSLICLHPNVDQTDNRIQPDSPVVVPARGSSFALRPSPPYGSEEFVVIVSPEPLRPDRFGVASLTDRPLVGVDSASGTFTRVDVEAVEQLLAGIRDDPALGAKVRLRVTTHPGNSE